MKTPKEKPDPKTKPRGLYDPPPGFNPKGMFWNGMCFERIKTETEETEPQITRGNR